MKGTWVFLGTILFFAVIGYAFNSDSTSAEQQKKIFENVSGVVLSIEEDYLLLGPAYSEIEAFHWRDQEQTDGRKPLKLYFFDDRKPFVQEGDFVHGVVRMDSQSSYYVLNLSTKFY
ncbi:hypothetical protein [Evansella halocellulosilytica]|uniref:hypothetical protein n=1 Tax=Evansella halocellulosilytica TaxID=2011013 RepID=UPI000BB87850|nr:hypothetical protein [Evansella halocellulosilytica]